MSTISALTAGQQYQGMTVGGASALFGTLGGSGGGAATATSLDVVVELSASALRQVDADAATASVDLSDMSTAQMSQTLGYTNSGSVLTAMYGSMSTLA